MTYKCGDHLNFQSIKVFSHNLLVLKSKGTYIDIEKHVNSLGVSNYATHNDQLDQCL